MFCASTLDVQGLEDRIKQVNAGKEEVFKPASLRETGLTMEDWKAFGQWMLQQRDLTSRAINKELNRLFHRRWAHWHVFGSPEELIPRAKSMFPTHCN